jgi:hypothetical protein
VVNFIEVRIRTSALVGHDDAGFVEVHAVQIGVISGTNGLLSENALQEVVCRVIFFVGMLVVETRSSFCLGTLCRLSCLVSMWIVLSGNYSMVNGPQVRVGHPSTIASVVSIVALKQVLH